MITDKIEQIKQALEQQPYIHVNIDTPYDKNLPHVIYQNGKVISISNLSGFEQDELSNVRKYIDIDNLDFSKSINIYDITQSPSLLDTITLTKNTEATKATKPSKSPLEVAIKENIPVLLIGETGTGKTTTIRELAKKHKKTFVRLNLNGQTNTDEFVGKWILKNGSTEWIDGVLTEAMKKGHWILIDEINAAQNDILFVLQSLLDDDNFIRLSEKDGSVVKPHKDFRLFAAMNPPAEYAGTKELNKAILSRFGVVLRYNYLGAADEIKMIVDKTKCTKQEATTLRAIAEQLRKAKDNDEILYVCSTRDLLYAGNLVKKGLDLAYAINVSIYNKADDEDKQQVLKIINDNINLVIDDYSDSISQQKELLVKLETQIAEKQQFLQDYMSKQQEIKDSIRQEVINELTNATNKIAEKYEI